MNTFLRYEGMHSRRRGRLIEAALLAGLSVLASLSVLAASCGTAAAAATSPSTGAADSSALVTVSLRVVSCPTTTGIPASGRGVSLPPSRPVAVPRAMATRLSVYADRLGVMELVGPKGWSCTAFIGADGSGGIAVYPHAEPVPRTWTEAWPLAGGSAATAVVGLETSACYTCTLAQACRLFASAASTLKSYLGRQTCPARPAAEKVTTVGAGIKQFEDPARTRGTGVPSGGRYPANGVMTYHPGAPAGSWMETCTLPASDGPACTAALNTFMSWYGRK
jgi:hypothetical protein